MAQLHSDNPFLTNELFANAQAASPFASRAVGLVAEAQEPELQGERHGDYVLPRRAPAPRASEVEEAGQSRLEVVVRWGEQVLRTAHLEANQTFTVGETDGDSRVDFEVPEALLGCKRWDVLAGGQVSAPALGRLERLEQGRAALELAAGEGVAVGNELWARVHLGELCIEVRQVAAGKRTARGVFSRGDRRAPLAFGLTGLVTASLLGAVAYFVPPQGLLDDPALEREQLVLMRAYLDSAQEREQAAVEIPNPEQGEAGEPGKSADAAEGEAGKMGRQDSQASGRLSIAKRHDGPTELSREAQLAEARDFGLIGILGSMAPDLPTADWGADLPNGEQDANHHGNLWGDDFGEGGGVNGLGLQGIAEGGGGYSKQLGFGGVNTCPQGLCTGWGNGGAFAKGDHTATAPGGMRAVETEVSRQGLPPEVIQRIVRQNFGRFRMCYEQGLRKNPNLAGRVSVRFVINSSGAVQHAANGGSDLPDAGVVSCVVQQYYGLSFPEPSSGAVTVTYPIVFQPS